jgi:murein L,D-transpeptidase YafK
LVNGGLGTVVRRGVLGLNRSALARVLLASAALAAAVALAGCETDGISPENAAKAMKPIPQKTLSEIAQKNMTKQSPILIRLFKQESELEVWKQDASGRMALLKTFPICRWSGELGPKIREGDRQAPEGFYTITPGLMNPASQYHLAVNIGFPNAYDRANDRTGAHLMIHGDCSSRGCYAMTDEQVSEIYALARESFFGGQRAFQIQAFPFRMTPTNMARHRNNPHMPFWKMLKEGYDHFEVTRLQPKVDVCEKRYVFNADQPDGADAPLNFSPREQCPIYEVPREIAAKIAEKQKKDEIAVAELVNRGTPAAPIKMGTDGGMHRVFVEALQGRVVKGPDGEERVVAVAAPGTIPPTVNPPSNVVIAAAPPAQPAATAAPALTQPASPSRSNSIVARAPAQPAARPAQAASIQQAQTAAAKPTQTASASLPGLEATKNFLSNMFTAQDSQNTAAPSSPAQAAKPSGLRGSTTAAAQPAAAPVAKPKPAALAEAKPRPLPEREDYPGQKVANAGTMSPQSPVSAFNGPPAAASSGLLSGAVPLIPAGSFGAAWPGLR